MAPTRWQPDRTPSAPPAWPVPPLATALGRGLLGRCPACGKAHLFNGFLRVVDACAVCHAPLGSARADDAPPYFVILITAHIVVPLILIMQRLGDPSNLELSAIFLPLTLVLSLGLLRPVKGGVVALMVTTGMLGDEPGPG